MPTPTKGARLGGSAAHQKIILANLATQLFEHGQITTTEAKARRLRPLAEKLITKAKRGDIHSRRLVLTTVKDKGVVHVLFTEIAPTFAEREGGYTRITKVGPRKGDNAPMAVIELVTESVEDSRKANAKSAAPAKKSPARKAPAKTAASARRRRSGGQRAGRGEPGRGTGQRHRRAGRVHQRAGAAPSDDTSAEEAEVVRGDRRRPRTMVEGSFRGTEPPTGFDIKGNENSMKFHTPESQWYDQTIAEVWFDSGTSARRGCRLREGRLAAAASRLMLTGCPRIGPLAAGRVAEHLPRLPLRDELMPLQWLRCWPPAQAGALLLVSRAPAESPSCCSAGWPRPGPRWPRPGRATPSVT